MDVAEEFISWQCGREVNDGSSFHASQQQHRSWMLINSGNVIWSTRSMLTSFKLNLSYTYQSIIDILLSTFSARKAWNLFPSKAAVLCIHFLLAQFQACFMDFFLFRLRIRLKSSWISSAEGAEKDELATNKNGKKETETKWLIVHENCSIKVMTHLSNLTHIKINFSFPRAQLLLLDVEQKNVKRKSFIIFLAELFSHRSSRFLSSESN